MLFTLRMEQIDFIDQNLDKFSTVSLNFDSKKQILTNFERKNPNFDLWSQNIERNLQKNWIFYNFSKLEVNKNQENKILNKKT